MNRILHCCILIFLIISQEVFPIQPQQVDYYGVVSTATDKNMIKMAQDLFFSQLKSIDNISVTDLRTGVVQPSAANISFSESGPGHLIFYAEIIAQEKNDGTIPPVTWKCIYHLISPAQNLSLSASEVYDSYYKILISAKAMIQGLINKSETSENTMPLETRRPDTDNTLNTEMIAGTWTGEPDIDKIIILRGGGRGFIIFKNGASMTVSILVTTESGTPTLEIRQTGKPNASFYPSLARDAILAAAASAEPMTWILHQTGPDTLTGIKSTLVSAPGTPDIIVAGTETVTWKKTGTK